MDTAPDVIRLLPDSVANQIAAGEVIQRPASVVKELVENSVDAGAKNIEVVVKDAGKTLIQVIDDGIGMSTTDARMAFERHATSKIRCADDLFTLHTMGFRGEALPSIAAVAELEVATRRETDELGTKLIIKASDVESQEPAMTAKGTNIKVKNLFFNFVARRRFLKKDNIELSHILHEFERLALVNTDVAFKLISNGVTIYSLPRGPLKERIGSLFGKTLSQHLIPVKTSTSLVQINGFVSLPEGARHRGQKQFLFVNGRNMRHPYFHKAILSCYDNLIPKDAQPQYFINFTVEPDRIDVNIHPQKHEIKFEDEQAIWQILTAAVRESLGRYNASSTLEFNNTDAPEIPVMTPGNGNASDLQSLGTDIGGYNPFELYKDSPAEVTNRFDFDFDSMSPGSQRMQSSAGTRPSALNSAHHEKRDFARGWEQFYESLKREKNDIVPGNLEEPTDETEVAMALFSDSEDSSRLVQFRKKYILSENEKGIIIIDQYRAHVNVLYHSFKEENESGNASVQNLLFPETIELDAQERVMLDSSIEIIERIGFRIGKDNEGNLTLDGIPGLLNINNPMQVLKNILNDLTESGVNVEEVAINRILLTMAKTAAIKGGQVMTEAEMEHLMRQLNALPSPFYTPDGLRVVRSINDDRLSYLFNS